MWAGYEYCTETAAPSKNSVSKEPEKMVFMRNIILLWLKRTNMGWFNDPVTLRAKFVSAVMDILWYIWTSWHTPVQCVFSTSGIPGVQGYNILELFKHWWRSSENMCSRMLNNFSEYLMQPWFSSAVWKPVKDCVIQLAKFLHKYSIYLKGKNTTESCHASTC